LKKGVSKQGAFLAAFRLTASITKAAEAAGIERQLHYRWLDDEPGYAQAFETAREEAAQALEDEAIRRAKEGIDEPVIYQGAPCIEIVRDEHGAIVYDEQGAPLARQLVKRKYSNQLLTFLLKGFKPEKYRDRTTVDVSGTLAVVVDRLAAARARLQDKDADA
jgi:hypothetical protein